MSAATAAPPTIPPRPGRAQQAHAQGADKLPEVPPRPIPKRLDRSVSPANYPQSPLNEPYNANMLSRAKSNDPSNTEAIPRRPSVQNLPSIGQEGMEYGDIQYLPTESSLALAADAGAQTRSVGEDLHLHAPKPSLPKSSATAQVQAVTRTDTQQPTVHSIGTSDTSQDEQEPLRQVRSRASFSRPGSSVSAERRSSVVYGDEQGPAELGIRVPINPLLGDVQAPSPAPFGMSPSHTGQGAENKKRPHHYRTKSGREVYPPPGSYGLHGHGVGPQDKFEKDWYARHPEQLQHEEGHGHGVYESIGSGRGGFALSSDDLNKIVRNTASRGAGFGTSGNTMSYPDEQIGYMASDQYATRSQLDVSTSLTKTLTNSSQPAVESPLKRSSFTADENDPDMQNLGESISRKSTENGDSDTDDIIHVDSPRNRYNKLTGGEETIHETDDLQPWATNYTEEGGLVDEHGYSVPILASDEVAKEINNEHMHPAVSPRHSRRGSQYEVEYKSGDATPTSRPSSRPGSIYGMHSASHSLARFVSHHDDRDTMHTPLEDVDEYEPLFPDEDGRQKALTTAERFRQRPDVLRHRFPSQDIWEDTPSSVMYEATVSTPDLPSQTNTAPDSKKIETQTEGIQNEEAIGYEKKRTSPKDEKFGRSKFAPHLRNEMSSRPGLAQRFPSQDIWEDSPDSSQLITTVSSPPIQDKSENQLEFPMKPAVPPRPVNKSKSGEESGSTQVAPNIPARPAKRIQGISTREGDHSEVPVSPTKSGSPTELRKVPSLPDRPKPQIPARPSKKISGETLSKTISSTSVDSNATNETEKAPPSISPIIAKAKPQVPARPAQTTKIANLKGNFMNDLNQKLGLGPPKEKEKQSEPEIEAESKPLDDARKGRARGPQRRAPAKSPSALPSSMPTSVLSISQPASLWHIDNSHGILNVINSKMSHENDKVSPMDKVDLPVSMSSDKVSQMENATTADAPLPPSIGMQEERSEEIVEDDPQDISNKLVPSLTKDTEGDPPTPDEEKSNPLSLHPSYDNSHLSKHTTASTGEMSGKSLEREEIDPSTDAIPASRQSTAESKSGQPLEKIKSNEDIEYRNEQVKAPAPNTVDNGFIDQKAANSTSEGNIPGQSDIASAKNVQQEQPTEPMTESDVSYKRLEELTAQADGKEKSEEENV